MHADIIQESN